jgi:RNA-dependent RNA polymerase
MVLEDLGVPIAAFKNLQDDAIAEAKTIHNSIEQFHRMLQRYNFGGLFRLRQTVERLMNMGFDLKPEGAPLNRIVDHPFVTRIRQFMMTHILREVKHSARIPIHHSHLLVGVADEGPSYKARGHDNVFILPAGMIFGLVHAFYCVRNHLTLSIQLVSRNPKTRSQPISKEGVLFLAALWSIPVTVRITQQYPSLY